MKIKLNNKIKKERAKMERELAEKNNETITKELSLLFVEMVKDFANTREMSFEEASNVIFDICAKKEPETFAKYLINVMKRNLKGRE